MGLGFVDLAIFHRFVGPVIYSGHFCFSVVFIQIQELHHSDQKVKYCPYVLALYSVMKWSLGPSPSRKLS